jgi:hypothetical protein
LAAVLSQQECRRVTLRRRYAMGARRTGDDVDAIVIVIVVVFFALSAVLVAALARL